MADPQDESHEMDDFSTAQQHAASPFTDSSPLLSGAASTRHDNSDDSRSMDSAGDAELGDLTLCCICSTNLPAAARITMTKCACVWCRECLNRCFRLAYTARANFPPVCCPNNRRIEPSEVQSCLDDTEAEYVTFFQEEFTTPNPTYCANLECRLFIPAIPTEAASRTLVCRMCAVETCRACKARQDAHGENGACISSAMGEDNEALMRRKGWKLCPGCATPVERNGGCRFVDCACGTAFCYECGRALQNRTTWGVRLCDCPRTPNLVEEHRGPGRRVKTGLYGLLWVVIIALFVMTMTLVAKAFQAK